MVDGYKMTYFPGPHRDRGAAPFLDSYPLHDAVITYDGAQKIISARLRGCSVRDTLWEMLTTNTPGILCMRCGLSWWDIMLTEALEPTFGAACVARPHYAKTVAEVGHNRFAEPLYTAPELDTVAVAATLIDVKAQSFFDAIVTAGGLPLLSANGPNFFRLNALKRDET